MPVTPLLLSIRVSSLPWLPVNLISLILDQCFPPVTSVSAMDVIILSPRDANVPCV